MRYKSNKNTNLGGYTLSDLLFGLGLTTIFLGISLPNISTQLKNHTLKKEAAILHNTIEKFYLTALRESKEIKIKILSHNYKIYSEQDDLLFNRTLDTSLLLKTITPDLRLFPSGTTTPATIKLSNGQKECKIKLSLRGRVSSVC
jgi:hypothetical protein